MTITAESLKSLIRDLLSTELAEYSDRSGAYAATSPQKQSREETVSLSTNSELNSFVLRLSELLANGRSKKEILEGRWVFRLAAGSSSGQLPLGQASFQRGLVSERQIEALPASTHTLSLGHRAVLTPLARDEADRRNIEIVRG